MLINRYCCPRCGNEWQDRWDCSCEDDCPSCGTRHITPVSSDEVIDPDADP